MNKKIYISLLGDINNPLEWSGTGYYCLENFKKIDKNIQGITLKTDSFKYKLKRIYWNLYQKLIKKGGGGFQYSEASLNFLWKNQKYKLKKTIIINFFPLFPKDINNLKSISKYFYIDLTINQLFKDYGSPKNMSKNYRNLILKKEKDGYKKCKHIFTHSDYAKEDLIKSYDIDEKNITTIVPGANFPTEFKFKKYKSHQNSQTLELLFIGKDLYRKGLDRLLEAINICNKKLPICNLHIVGNKLKVDKRFKKYEKMKNVFQYGFLDKKKDIKKFEHLFNICDVGILLSRAEAGGMSLREFAFAGLPTISTSVGGMPDHINNSASLLIASKNSEEIINNLVEKLRLLYFNKNELQKLTYYSFEDQNEYSWQRSCEKIINKIHDLE